MDMRIMSAECTSMIASVIDASQHVHACFAPGGELILDVVV